VTAFGSVEDNHEPIAGAKVTLSGSQTATTYTGFDGLYYFTGLPVSGFYLVTPSMGGFNFSPMSARFFDLSTSQTANFYAPPSPSPIPPAMHLDFAGLGRSGALLYDPSIGQFYTAMSNADGTYTYVPNLFSPGFDILRSGDFNDDGLADLVLYNSLKAYIALIGASPRR
jgi:hypothetical protein